MILRDKDDLKYYLIKNTNDYISIYDNLKCNEINLLSLCFIDNEYRLYLGFYDEYFYKSFDAYIKMFLLNYEELKQRPDYKSMEEANIEFCNEMNIRYDFKPIFTSSFSDWVSCYYEECDLDDTYCPERYFEYIIKNSNIELKENFNIASIDFIEVNKKDKISGRMLLNKAEDMLRLFNIEEIILQLLEPKLKDYYKKHNYKKLETINSKCDAEFMYKKIN